MAYGLANILAAIPITPGGLGVVEFVLVSMITGFGPTAGQALSAVLAYRAVNFWLPIPFGGLAYASLEFERRRPSGGSTVVRHRIHLLPEAHADAPVDPEPGGRAGVHTARPERRLRYRRSADGGRRRRRSIRGRPIRPVPPAPRRTVTVWPGGEPRVPVRVAPRRAAGIRAPVFETDPAR